MTGSLQRSLFVFLAALVLSVPAQGAASLEGLSALIRKFKQDTGQSSGTAIVVVDRGGVVHEGCFGYADIEARTPVGPETAFYIASATKPLFALGVLSMEERGELDTATRLRAMFPEVRFEGIAADEVRISHLLTHTSGVDNAPLAYATAFSGLHDANSRRALLGASTPNREAPLGQFDYTNVGYNIVSVWLEAHSGRTWQDQLHAEVFVPLGMRRSSASMSAAKAAGWAVARPYSRIGSPPDTPLYLEKSDETMHAAGGVVASAPDLGRLLQAELAEGRVDGRQAFPAEVIARSQQMQARFPSAPSLDFDRVGYAWGWYSGDYKGQRLLHHFGAFAGYHAHVSFMPEAGIGLIVLNNEDFLAPRLSALIADYVYSTALGEPEVEARMREAFAATTAQMSGIDDKVRDHRRALAARPWRLSVPMEEYAGRYAHPWLGEIDIAIAASGRPLLRWGRLQDEGTAYEDADSVRVEFVPNSGQVVRFEIKDGAAAALVFEGMRFDRVAVRR